MNKISPFIRCVDYWPGQIPQEKLEVYDQLIREKQITKPHVVFNRNIGSTMVEYFSIAPHKWILEEMKRRCSQ